MTAAVGVLGEVLQERVDQEAKWGEQNHPDGTGALYRVRASELQRRYTELGFERGEGTWTLILLEEVAEALAESDEARLREELVQVAAVAVSWVEAIDRRRSS
jgi:hypothetical protein